MINNYYYSQMPTLAQVVQVKILWLFILHCYMHKIIWMSINPCLMCMSMTPQSAILTAINSHHSLVMVVSCGYVDQKYPPPWCSHKVYHLFLCTCTAWQQLQTRVNQHCYNRYGKKISKATVCYWRTSFHLSFTPNTIRRKWKESQRAK